MEMIRPSGSHEWHHCKASHVMQEGLPNDDSDAAREGTAAHWVASEILLSYIETSLEVKTPNDFIGTLAPNDVYIDEEMTDAARTYANDVLDYCNKTGLLQHLHVEEEMNLDHIYPGMTGTPDCWVYNAAGHELVVWDFKYGHGYVDVFENPQLIIYASGAVELSTTDPSNSSWLKMRLRIAQPRCFSGEGVIREWCIHA